MFAFVSILLLLANQTRPYIHSGLSSMLGKMVSQSQWVSARFVDTPFLRGMAFGTYASDQLLKRCATPAWLETMESSPRRTLTPDPINVHDSVTDKTKREKRDRAIMTRKHRVRKSRINPRRVTLPSLRMFRDCLIFVGIVFIIDQVKLFCCRNVGVNNISLRPSPHRSNPSCGQLPSVGGTSSNQ